jgi:hypothetical protein
VAKKEDKALAEILADIEMDDFHYAIKYGRKREIDKDRDFSK